MSRDQSERRYIIGGAVIYWSGGGDGDGRGGVVVAGDVGGCWF